MSLREDYATQYWQLGNIITGFRLFRFSLPYYILAQTQPLEKP